MCGEWSLVQTQSCSFRLLGAAAVTLAGYSAYAKRANRAMAAEQAISFAGRIDEPQISNRAAKTNRLLSRQR